MGWFYRRSARFGPFRLNFSKSGIGVSAGIKGARVSTGPRGTYVNLGTNGVYYRQKIGGGYSAASSADPGQSNPSAAQQNLRSLPGNLNYPSFPHHGFPRIVTTLLILTVVGLILSICILTLIGLATSSTNPPSLHANKSRPLAETAANKPVESKREQGYQAGYDYWLRNSTSKNQKLDQRRVKKLATEAAAKEHQVQEWQLGWIAGYNKAFESAVASRTNDNRSVTSETTSRQSAPTTFQTLRRSTSNGYIRGPRGGCYYLSGSGRKVYVDRGLCN